MKNIKTFIGIIIVILIILLFREWIRKTIITNLGGYLEKETTITIDSTFVKGKIDTLEVFNHYVKTNGIILNPEPEIIYKFKNLVTEEIGDSLKYFQVSIKDSVIDGTINIYNKFNGDLSYANLNYKPIYPKLIKQTDTIIITKTIRETLTNNKSLIGLGAGYTNLNNLHYSSLSASYMSKKKLQVLIEYGKPLNEVKTIIDNKQFTTNSSDLWSIKLIKHF